MMNIDHVEQLVRLNTKVWKIIEFSKHRLMLTNELEKVGLITVNGDKYVHLTDDGKAYLTRCVQMLNDGTSRT